MDYVNYVDHVGGYHYTADQGCVWLYGCRSKSVGTGLDCGHSPAPSVTHCADALAVCGVWRINSIIIIVYYAIKGCMNTYK